MSLYRDAKEHYFKENCKNYVRDLQFAYSDVEPLSDDDIVRFYYKYESKVRVYEFSEISVLYRINDMGLTRIIGYDLDDVMKFFDDLLEGKNMSDIGIIGLYSSSENILETTRYVKIIITTKP